MFSLVNNETDIENCSGRKKLYELINDNGKEGSKYSCAYEAMNTPECGKSFFFGQKGVDRMCYCESIGSSCTRTSSAQFTEYRLIQGKLIINDVLVTKSKQKPFNKILVSYSFISFENYRWHAYNNKSDEHNHNSFDNNSSRHLTLTIYIILLCGN